MADAATLQRLARKLAETGGATPAGVGYWETLAGVADQELNRTITVTTGTLPSEPFLALAIQIGASGAVGLRYAGSGMSVASVTNVATQVLKDRGEGTIWIVEVKRVLDAS